MQEKIRHLKQVYLVFFFFTLHYALGLYINSSFLESGCNCGLSPQQINILFTAGSILSLFLVLLVKKIKSLAGSFKHLYLASHLITTVSLIVFSFSSNVWVVGTFFILYWGIVYFFTFLTDFFIEAYSEDSTTGNTRGVFLTIAGLGVMLSPLLSGLLTGKDNNFRLVYIVAVIFNIISFLLFIKFKNKWKSPNGNSNLKWLDIKNFFSNKNKTGAFLANLSLQFFYSWMIIYTPIYLRQSIGLEWSQIGLIFTIMLIPFVIFEIPLGKLADKKLGEKEIIIASIIIMSIATGVISFYYDNNVLIWAIILFITRLGASGLQVASESYFFKQVNETNLSDISIFRQAPPVAFTLGPILASLVFFMGVPTSKLFMLLGIFLLLAIPTISRIKDSK